MDELSFRCEKENIILIFPSAKHMHKPSVRTFHRVRIYQRFQLSVFCYEMKLKIVKSQTKVITVIKIKHLHTVVYQKPTRFTRPCKYNPVDTSYFSYHTLLTDTGGQIDR